VHGAVNIAFLEQIERTARWLSEMQWAGIHGNALMIEDRTSGRHIWHIQGIQWKASVVLRATRALCSMGIVLAHKRKQLSSFSGISIPLIVQQEHSLHQQAASDLVNSARLHSQRWDHWWSLHYSPSASPFRVLALLLQLCISVPRLHFV